MNFNEFKPVKRIDNSLSIGGLAAALAILVMLYFGAVYAVKLDNALTEGKECSASMK